MYRSYLLYLTIFINWAESHVANKKELLDAVQKERCHRQKGAGQGSCTNKKWTGSGKVIFLKRMAGGCQVDDPTSADQVIPDGLVEVFIPGKGETVIKLGIKSQFGYVVFSVSDSIWSLLSLSLLFLTIAHFW